MPVTSKTALFSQKQAGGLFSIEDQSLSTGSRFFVHSGTGTDGAGYGRNPEAPFATIDYAVALCTANKNDIIYVMPGHAETVSAAADIALDVAGISVIGLGNGLNRPTITFDTADTADVDIDAANVTIENVIFSANFADVATAIDVNATDFTLKRCHFQATATDMNFLVCVQDAAAAASDRISIIECTSFMLDAADTHFINMAGTGDGHIVRDNILHGNWGTMCIGGAGIVTRCTILRNAIFNIATDADCCISMAATATGICAFNACTGGHASQGIIPGDLGAIENYYEQSTSDLSGVIEPATA
jgi:hypothetical protein